MEKRGQESAGLVVSGCELSPLQPGCLLLGRQVLEGDEQDDGEEAQQGRHILAEGPARPVERVKRLKRRFGRYRGAGIGWRCWLDTRALPSKRWVVSDEGKGFRGGTRFRSELYPLLAVCLRVTLKSLSESQFCHHLQDGKITEPRSCKFSVTWAIVIGPGAEPRCICLCVCCEACSCAQ